MRISARYFIRRLARRAGPFFYSNTVCLHARLEQEEEKHGENCRRNERRRG